MPGNQMNDSISNETDDGEDDKMQLTNCDVTSEDVKP